MKGTTAYFYTHDYAKKWPGLTLKLAKKIGDEIGVDWSRVDLGEFIQGIKEEQEHYGILGGEVSKVIDRHDYHSSARIAYEHILEVPNYYTLLEELEHKGDDMFPNDEAKIEWVKTMRDQFSDKWSSVSA